MYQKKTGKLFEFSFAAPFILSNANKNYVKFAKDFGLLFGLIFQIIDDLIDQTGSFKKIGKTPGKDTKQQKSTLLKLIGKKQIIQFCNKKIDKFEKKYKTMLRRNKV